VAAEQALTRRLGAIMPVYMTIALLAVIAVAVVLIGDDGFGFALAAALALGAMLALTLTRNVPLNQQTMAFPPDGDAYAWEAIRRPWERLHVLRVVLDLAAFACLIAVLTVR
jgi:uncharacterized membrane protein